MRRLKRIGSVALALWLALVMAAPAHAWPGMEATGAASTIEIAIYKTQPILTIQVVDKASGAGIPNVRVELRDPDHLDTPPITGSPLGIHETGPDGKIEIKLFSDTDKKYQIWVDHLGYAPYAGDVFTVTEDTCKLVELEKAQPGPVESRRIYVYYHAGVGGTVDGVEQERLRYGESPKNVPEPIPDDGYAFAGWMLDGKYVEPDKLKVRKNIHLYAVFELLPEPAPVPPPPAPAPPAPAPPSPAPQDPETPTPPGGGTSVQPQPVKPGTTGHGGSNKPGSAVIGNGPASGPEDNEAGPVPGSDELEPGPSIPVFGPGLEEPDTDEGQGHSQCRVHWWVLLCTVLTAALGLLRLRTIHRRIKRLDQQAEKELSRK